MEVIAVKERQRHHDDSHAKGLFTRLAPAFMGWSSVFSLPFSRGLSRFSLLVLFSDVPTFFPDFNGLTVNYGSTKSASCERSHVLLPILN
jgi:hypothetical protein